MLPNWVGVPAMVTGHLFVLLSGLMLPFGLMCKATVADCVNWSIEPGPGRIPWVMEGQAGYCVNKIMVPTSTCAQLAEVVGFWGLVLGLLAIYFLIGAIVGVLIEKWKKRKI